jgi:hypothetical protein
MARVRDPAVGVREREVVRVPEAARVPGVVQDLVAEVALVQAAVADRAPARGVDPGPGAAVVREAEQAVEAGPARELEAAPERDQDQARGAEASRDLAVDRGRVAVAGQAVELVREQEVELALGRAAERDQARDGAADRVVAPAQELVATQEAARARPAVRARVRGAGAASLLARAAEPARHRDPARERVREKVPAPENLWDQEVGPEAAAVQDQVADLDLEVDRARAAEQVPAAVAGQAVAQAVELVREQEVELALGRAAERDQARDAAADREVAPDQELVATQGAARAPPAVRARVLGAGAVSLLARAAEPARRRDLVPERVREKVPAPENLWDQEAGPEAAAVQDPAVDRARAAAADQVPAAVVGQAVAQAVERVREQEVERVLGRAAERDQARDEAADRVVAPDQERVATQGVVREPLAVRARALVAGAVSLLARAAEPVGHRDRAREPGREKVRAVVAVDPAQAPVAGRVQGAARAPVPARVRARENQQARAVERVLAPAPGPVPAAGVVPKPAA